jgi:hypothetical protein
MNEIFPKFIRYKLYKKSLHYTDFYKETLQRYLEMEIKSKEKELKRANTLIKQLKSAFENTVSFMEL